MICNSSLHYPFLSHYAVVDKYSKIGVTIGLWLLHQWEMASVRSGALLTWCHQLAGMNRQSPGMMRWYRMLAWSISAHPPLASFVKKLQGL